MSPQDKKEKEDRRAEILKAAFEAFAESGYDKTSMDDIVRRSGLSKGTLYWHFKNKHDLFLATINMAMGDLPAAVEQLMFVDAPASERLRTLFLEAAKMFIAQENMIGLLANAFFQSSQSDEAKQVMRESYTEFIDPIAQIIQQGIDHGEFKPVDPRTVAIAFIGGGDGIAFHTLLDPDWNVMAVMASMIDLMLDGMRKDPDA